LAVQPLRRWQERQRVGRIHIQLLRALVENKRERACLGDPEEREVDRRNSFRTDRPDVVVRRELLRTGLPFVINGSLLGPLYALSRMGYGDDARLQEPWAQLDGRRDPQGRYVLDWHPQGYFRPGPKGNPPSGSPCTPIWP